MKLSILLNDYISNIKNDMEIEGICCNPIECKSNDLLFLLNDKAEDDFLRYSPIAKAIIAKSYLISNFGIDTYIVSNPRYILSKAMAKMYCGDISNIKFIGVTGTNGKSTTAIMIKNILIDAGYRVGLFGTGKITLGNDTLSSNDYSMTTPPPEVLYPLIGNMKDMGVDVIIMEVSSHALIQERVAAITFDIGIFTNLSEEHLDYHQNMENYYLAKTKLLVNSKKAIINADDFHGKLALDQFSNSEGCGISSSDNTVTDIKSLGFDGSEFTYCSKQGCLTFHIKPPGIYNIYNAMLAIRAAENCNVSLSDIKRSIEKINSIDGRYEIISRSPLVIIDYAHTSYAFENIIKNIVSNKKTEQNLCVVFGCGGNRDKSKRSIMGKIADKYADKIIITSDNPRYEDPDNIINEISSNITQRVYKISNRKSAIKFAIKSASDNDIIAIIGKGPEKYTIIQDKYYSFDEKSIINETLLERSI